MEQLSPEQLKEFQRIAKDVRQRIVRTVHKSQGGHIGGSLSIVEILIALYYHTLRIDPAKPGWEDRDRFVLSKGHAAVGLYSILAEKGYFPIEEVETFDAVDSRMQAHPDMNITPGIDMSTGSLGQGLSVGIGIALGARMLGKDFRTYVMIGDGEMQEGQIWEAAFAAHRYRLDNLTAILDFNKVQLYGWQHPAEMMPMENPAEKFEAFGWHTIEIDGHDYQAIVNAFDQAKHIVGKPTIIIADTVKGKGVSFMEGKYQWHAAVPSDEDAARALEELS